MSDLSINNYLERIKWELSNQDKIPDGMPEWIRKELIKYEDILSNREKFTKEEIGEVLFSLENDVFKSIDALKEDDSYINELKAEEEKKIREDELAAKEIVNRLVAAIGGYNAKNENESSNFEPNGSRRRQ